jgi:hypothetical protein
MPAFLLEHDPEKCAAVFRRDHGQSKTLDAMAIQRHPIARFRANMSGQTDHPRRSSRHGFRIASITRV